MYWNTGVLNWVHLFQSAVDERSFSITVALIPTKVRNGLHAETPHLQIRNHAEWSKAFNL